MDIKYFFLLFIKNFQIFKFILRFVLPVNITNNKHGTSKHLDPSLSTSLQVSFVLSLVLCNLLRYQIVQIFKQLINKIKSFHLKYEIFLVLSKLSQYNKVIVIVSLVTGLAITYPLT